MSNERIIKVGALARVEGEGALYVRTSGEEILDVRLEIFEPPRFFEAFLQGRSFREVPDITARICGICPVAYQMSSVHALEGIFGTTIHPQIDRLRRLLYCGEWIESQSLHVLMLHAPDFLGFDSVIEMAAEHRGLVEQGLQLKKTGNALVAAVGGREIHPVNVRVGGFYRAPLKRELKALRDPLLKARDTALAVLKWVGGFDFPDLDMDYEFVALVHPEEYPMNHGRLCSSRGLDIEAREFEEHFQESHVKHSNALHCLRKNGGTYHVGPLARMALNHERLPKLVLDALAEVAYPLVCKNPFKSIIARAAETLYAVDEALRQIDLYEPPPAPFTEPEVKAGVGWACTEAPRGTLYHRYRIGDDGLVQEAQIIAPTSQNQAQIEADLRQFLPQLLELPHDDAQWKCEQAIRNYDPCISCSAHFLKLQVERS